MELLKDPSNTRAFKGLPLPHKNLLNHNYSFKGARFRSLS